MKAFIPVSLLAGAVSLAVAVPATAAEHRDPRQSIGPANDAARVQQDGGMARPGPGAPFGPQPDHEIAPARLAPADLVFFGKGGEVTHVGIYIGEGRFVHAPRTGGTVRLDHLDGAWWRDHYTGAKRVLQ